MNNSLTFALPSGFDYDIKTFSKEVKTKKWTTKFKNELRKYEDKFTNSGNDDSQTVKSLLQAAYGVNIGEQVFDRLNESDINKIKNNVTSTISNTRRLRF
jgi:Icc-related predicted phosphoesterase